MPGPKRLHTNSSDERAEMFSEIGPRLSDVIYFAEQIGCLLDHDGNPPEIGKAWAQVGEELRKISERIQKLAK